MRKPGWLEEARLDEAKPGEFSHVRGMPLSALGRKNLKEFRAQIDAVLRASDPAPEVEKLSGMMDRNGWCETAGGYGVPNLTLVFF